VLEAQPDAIVHQATALADARFSKHLDRSFVETNRLSRGHGLASAAARETGASRFVAQSFANMRYPREGGPVKTEEDPLDPAPVAGAPETFEALPYLDEAVTGAGGIALRYGLFYGASNDGPIEPVRKRQFPIVGDGGMSSFIHLDDAAAATVLALEHDQARGASNARARRELGWTLRYPTWRRGFAAVYARTTSPAARHTTAAVTT
jgi:nucleoside-diphosphate-sugar epimerase